MNLPVGTKTVTSDNSSLRQVVQAHLVNPPKDAYIPAKHNPSDPIRPGADDHKKFKSLSDKGTVVYRDRGHV